MHTTPAESQPVNPAEAKQRAHKAFVRHLARKRRYADAFADAGLFSMSAKLRDCSETQNLVFCQECAHCWYVPDRCRSRVCPICAYRISLERAKFLETMCQHMIYPKMLTLTMPLWTDDPREGIRYLRDRWNALRRHAVFAAVKGGAYQIELKPKPAGWHIHIHAILDSPYLPYQRVFSVWSAILGLDAAQVDIRAATTSRQRAYTCKYAAKSADFEGDLADVVAWYLATKGSRLFATFGTWYNVTPAQLFAEEGEEPYVSACPKCGAVGTCCYARDGPFVLGKNAFELFERSVLKGMDQQKPLPIRAEVDQWQQSKTQ